MSTELLAFIADRLKVHLRDQGVRHDLIAAASVQARRPDLDGGDGTTKMILSGLLARVSALEDFLASEDGANLLIAYRRASNIVAIEERKDGWAHRIDRRPRGFAATAGGDSTC